jgi:DNA-binding NtrC family response regulator
VVLRGETGVGKEVLARAIHELSDRKDAPFVVCDCANLNRELLGSELFGHRKGAFTGAVAAHRGVFERAHRGTLLLDEIGELPAELQTRLLGVLQRREVQPLGSEAPIPVDVRVLAATHRDLEALVEAGTFREDLYFRLAVFTVEMPPLRDRAEDIPLLAEAFLAELGPASASPPRLSDDVRGHLMNHAWPGNVRELRNAVQRALVRAGTGPIQPAHFDATKLSAPVVMRASSRPLAGKLEDAERQMILEALRRNGWHRDRTARDLGISLSTLKRRVRELRLAGPSEPGSHRERDEED